MTELDIYKSVLGLYEDPAHWTQRDFGRDETGKPVKWYGKDSKAVCWCLIGALDYVQGTPSDYAYISTLVEKVQHHEYGIASYNDTHTYEEVINLLKECVTDLEQST